MTIILYENIFLVGTPTVTSEATGFPKEQMWDLRPYTSWKATSAATQEIISDPAAKQSADCIGIYRHNLGSIGATIQIQYADSYGGPYTLETTIVPTDNSPIMKYFTNRTKYWKIRITSSSSAQIGVLVLGDMLQFPYPPDAPYSPSPETARSKQEYSKGGHLLGVDVRYNEVAPAPVYSNIERAWVKDYFNVFWNAHGKFYKPFFFAWDFDNSPGDIFFVRFQQDVQMSRPVINGHLVSQLPLSFIGVL